MKIPTSVRLDQDVYDRIKSIATVDRRSIAEVVAWAVERGLPSLEAELHIKEAALRAEPPEIKIGTQKKQAA